MSNTLLQLVQQAAGEIGSIGIPTAVATSSQETYVQLLYLINGRGTQLMRKREWQALSKQYMTTVSFTTITGNVTSGSSNLTGASSIVGIDTTYGISGPGINQACYVNSTPSGAVIPLSQPATGNYTGQTYTLTKVKYAMPSDYDRQVNRTHWDKTKHWEMLGPETPQQWEWLISGYISTGPRIRYRIFGNLFQIWPFVASAETIGFEYQSNAWVTSAAGVAQSSFLADTDTCIFPDRLIIEGLKLSYLDSKGFDSTATQLAYRDELNQAIAMDQGAPTLSFAPRQASILISGANLPDSNYGL